MEGRQALSDRCAAYEAMLEKCRDQFAFYASQHAAKDPPQLAKSQVNTDFVEQINLLLGGNTAVSGNLTARPLDQLLADVREFHEVFGLTDWLPGEMPVPLTIVEVDIRAKWIKSEAQELIVDTEGAMAGNIDPVDLMAKQVDALIDAIYFAAGGLVRMGLDAAPLWAIVHGQNMAKRQPDGSVLRREGDRKIVKPEGWVDPHQLLVAEIKRQVGL